jgi:hypothetical protein
MDTAVISALPALGWLRQEAHTFKASLGYIGRLSQKTPKTKTKIQIKTNQILT